MHGLRRGQPQGSGILAGLVWILVFGSLQIAPGQTPSTTLQQTQALYQEGNYRDAYELARQLLLDRGREPRPAPELFNIATNCLSKLHRYGEIDGFGESVAAARPDDWRILWCIARNQRLPAWFRALDVARNQPDESGQGPFYFELGQAIARFAGQNLMGVARLNREDDVQDDWDDSNGPVDEHGDPVFHHVPPSFAAAKTDGERWRWCLDHAVKLEPTLAARANFAIAEYYRQLYGSWTPSDELWELPRGRAASQPKTPPLPDLSQLSDEETVCRVATGIKHFRLPEDCNFIKILRTVAEQGDKDDRMRAWRKLAHIFDARRQFVKAADCWRNYVELGGKDGNRELIDIEGAWGRFEAIGLLKAGVQPRLKYACRNGARVYFRVQPVDIDMCLRQQKEMLLNSPKNQSFSPPDLASAVYWWMYRLSEREDPNESELAADGWNADTPQKPAALPVPAVRNPDGTFGWSVAVEPRDDHLETELSVPIPVRKAGLYRLTAELTDRDGRPSWDQDEMVMWLADTVLVRKPLWNEMYYFVGDAVDGRPIAGAELRFLGYRATFDDHKMLQAIDVKEFSATTDDQGAAIIGPDRMLKDYEWSVTARTRDGRFAQLGYTTGVTESSTAYVGPWVTDFVMTDRPIYRPGDVVRFKFWSGCRDYTKEEPSPYAGHDLFAVIRGPDYKVLHRQRIHADAWGGGEGKWSIPVAASLGGYQIDWETEEQLESRGYSTGQTFRVEEFRKPEFEVHVETPTEPIRLGDKFRATVKARYYFGSPVSEGRVRLTVHRRAHFPEDRWGSPWSWLYSNESTSWEGKMDDFGVSQPPTDDDIGYSPRSSELCLARDLLLDAEGAVTIDIDTADARNRFGDRSHDYTITAEVTDGSSRVIAAAATAIVGPVPFKVRARFDRGYYRVGQPIIADFTARTLRGQPIRGTGVLSIYRLRRRGGRVEETLVHTRELAADGQGQAHWEMLSRDAGRYRFSYAFADKHGDSSTAEHVVVVLGESEATGEQPNPPLEVLADKHDYRPGETAKLLINTDRPGSTVLLFVRANDYWYPRPEMVRLRGRSTFYEIPVGNEDVPNFFVEAVAISEIRLHTAVCEIRVPPVQRLLHLTVTADREKHRPGEAAKLQLRLVDDTGKPVVGSAVVTVYDKALEQIAGGTNVADVRQAFWGGCRQYLYQSETNLSFRSFSGQNSTWSRLDGHDDHRRPKRSLADAAGLTPTEPDPPRSKAVVRSRFDDTAFWAGGLVTGPDGVATAEFELPDTATTWKIRAWGLGRGSRVGQDATEFITGKDLLLRMQTPRRFVERDEIVVSANIRNDGRQPEEVQPLLELEGRALETLDGPAALLAIAPGQEIRADWRVRVLGEGLATLRMKALGRHESDAMEKQIPCREHGMLKTVSQNGAMRSHQNSVTLTVDVPPTKRPASTRLELRFSPTIAGAVVDAVPFLVNSEFGSTEQTLNRFLGAVVAQQLLLDLDVDLEAIRRKRFEPTASEADEARRSENLAVVRGLNLVFNPEELTTFVQRGMDRLAAMQLSNGAWGWFAGGRECSSPDMTALIVHGLTTARRNKIAVPNRMLRRGVDWLAAYRDEESQELQRAFDQPGNRRERDDWRGQSPQLDLKCLVHMVLVDADRPNPVFQDRLYALRHLMSLPALAQLGLAAQKSGDREKCAMILRNIEQYLEQDEENQTAWLRVRREGMWWGRYSNSGEANAWCLRFLAGLESKRSLASRVAKYLLIQRKNATFWSSTRDTALCVEALADYVRASGEARPQGTLEIRLDGRRWKSVVFDASNLLDVDTSLVIEGDALRPGRHVIELQRTGAMPIYYASYLTAYTDEDRIGQAGGEIRVNRSYHLLQSVESSRRTVDRQGQPTTVTTDDVLRRALPPDAVIRVGDVIEVQLDIDVRNGYDYLVLEDQKPAGFEPAQQGRANQIPFLAATANAHGEWYESVPLHVEHRDDRVVFFIARLKHGKCSVSYRMRPELPGRLHALPARVWGMYGPELRANSDEACLTVEPKRE